MTGTSVTNKNYMSDKRQSNIEAPSKTAETLLKVLIEKTNTASKEHN